MYQKQYGRLQFLKNITLASMGATITGIMSPVLVKQTAADSRRVGMIGLDTSHCLEFTKMLNAVDAGNDFGGYKVVAAYPHGSFDIPTSTERIPEYTEKIKEYGVSIEDSVAGLLEKVDVVLLETNDGRLHLQQALQVIGARKPLFIDKPMAISVKDARQIFDKARASGVPVFSSSALRFITSVQDVVAGKVGRVLGADAYSPAKLEKTHPDLFWYGIHGVELLFTVMGPGCESVVRVHTEDTDVVVGTWRDGRVGTFRGIRKGEYGYGGTVFGDKGNTTVGPYDGYRALLQKITEFFRTGIPPVSAAETLEILTFMEAADKSKLGGGIPVSMTAAV